MTRLVGMFALSGALALAAACGGDEEPAPDCTTLNATQVCDCVGDPGGGVQTCTADGTWSVCDCGGADVGDDVIPDATDDVSDDVDATDDVDGGEDPMDDVDCPDEDDDGVCDADDLCPGEDDTIDTDRDGTPDGCDLCPVGADFFDEDDDGVPDGCDACPGFDDRLDEDEDGIPDDCDCNETWWGHELCDLQDNDCDGTVDDGCRPIRLQDLDAFACMPFVNGNFIAPGTDGLVFVGEFPGVNSAQGTLHSVARDGTVHNDIRALPYGLRGLERSLDGSLYAWGTGGDSFPDWNHEIVELDPADGSPMGVVYEQPWDSTGESMYLGDLAAAPDGELYVGDSSAPDPPIYRVDGTSLTEWAVGHGNNPDLVADPSSEQLWLRTATGFGTVAESGEPVTVFEYSDAEVPRSFPQSLTVTADGVVWVSVRLGDHIDTTGAALDRFDPATGDLIRVLEYEGDTFIVAEYDPDRDEVVIYAPIVDADQSECVGVGGSYYAIEAL